MISQTASMTVSTSALIASKGAAAAAIIHLLGPSPRIRFLEILRLTIIGVHRRILNFGISHPHSLKLRWASLIAGTIGVRHALNTLVSISSLRSVLFVQP